MGYDHPSLLAISDHARWRMRVRCIRSDAVDVCVDYGREVHTRGAVVYAIGRREVRMWRDRLGVDLTAFEGVQVVCSRDDGTVLTVYRNRDFRRLRPKLGRRFAPGEKAA